MVSRELRTGRLVGRTPSDEDVDALLEIYSLPEVTRWLSADGHPRTRREVVRMVQRDTAHWEAHGFGRWYWFEVGTSTLVARCGPRFAVVCGQAEVELHWTVRPDKQGSGYATEAAGAATTASFDHLSITSAVAYSHVENHASLAVMRKTGFAFERTFDLNTQPSALHRRRSTGGAV